MLTVHDAEMAGDQELLGQDWQMLDTAEYVLAPHWMQVPVVVLW
jgi:hypothetical protein